MFPEPVQYLSPRHPGSHKIKLAQVCCSVAHPVFADVAMSDYLSFYEREIIQREQWKYPPYYQLIKIILKHKVRGTVSEAAILLTNLLKRELGNRVLGPAF